MGSDLVIGVDGGGSNTRAWIASRETADQSNVLGRGRAGGSNPQTVGAASATQSIQRAVQLAFADAKLDRQRVASACLCLAGADRESDRLEFQQWAERIELSERLMITNDATAVLYAASPDGVGVALIAGTGSFAFGRDAAGKTTRSGGWGWLFGDEGSGYTIAREALRAAARSADGRGPQTQLLERFLEHLQLRSPNDLISKIYSHDVDRARIASFAPIVFDADDQGDFVAGRIIQDAVVGLAETVEAVAGKLSFRVGGFLLALSGGVLLNRPKLRDQLCQEMTCRRLTPREIASVAEPVAGAVLLASQYDDER